MNIAPYTEAPTWLPAIATVTSGLVAALVAIAVTWLGHVFTARREARKLAADRQTERAAFLREKLETLVSLVGEHIDYRNSYAMHVGTLGIYAATVQQMPEQNISGHGATALDRAQAIATLYFPPVNNVMEDISVATLNHVRFLSDEVAVISRDSAEWTQEWRPTYGARSATALFPLIAAKKQLSTAARKLIENDLAP